MGYVFVDGRGFHGRCNCKSEDERESPGE